jgi:hypothetical protein
MTFTRRAFVKLLGWLPLGALVPWKKAEAEPTYSEWSTQRFSISEKRRREIGEENFRIRHSGDPTEFTFKGGFVDIGTRIEPTQILMSQAKYDEIGEENLRKILGWG